MKLRTLAFFILSATAAPIAMAQVDVQVVDDYGYAVPHFSHPYSGQQWILGEEGQRYNLRIRNYYPERVLVVVSVDGVNAVTGETASTNQGGYVLEPGQVTDVAGWRKSQQDVARFYFTYPSNSYAERTGRPANVGVIGAAVFRERYHGPVMAVPLPYPPPPPPLPRPTLRSQEAGPSEAEAMPSAPPVPEARSATAEGIAADNAAGASAKALSAVPAPSLGTGHGERQWSSVQRTRFDREPYPMQTLEFRYGSYEQLVREGVLPQQRRYHSRPRAFSDGFVPDP